MNTITNIQSKVIDSATGITMDAFIDIMVDDKLELLVVKGNPTENELRTAWEKIYSEYTDALGDDSHRELLTILRDINLLSWQHQRVCILLEVLTVCYVPSAVDELKRYGYVIKYDPDDLNRYYRDLQSVYERSKTMLVKISVRQKDLEELQQKSTGKHANRADFQTMLISLSEYAKYQVSPMHISAYQFAVMMRRCNEYAKGLQNQIHKGGKGWQKN